jgi:hypothetical protein
LTLGQVLADVLLLILDLSVIFESRKTECEKPWDFSMIDSKTMTTRPVKQIFRKSMIGMINEIDFLLIV